MCPIYQKNKLLLLSQLQQVMQTSVNLNRTHHLTSYKYIICVSAIDPIAATKTSLQFNKLK